MARGEVMNKARLRRLSSVSETREVDEAGESDVNE